MPAVTRPKTYITRNQALGFEYACHRISSFEKKPAKPGMPEMASVPMSMVR